MLVRARRWTGEQLAFLIVSAVMAAGFVYLAVASGRWARAAGVVSVSMLLAALLRGVLPTSRVGLLAVRVRWIDTVVYLVVGGVILAVDIRLHR